MTAEATPGDILQGSPMVVLINRGSAPLLKLLPELYKTISVLWF